MNKNDLELETKYEIWNNKIGCCIEVGPDRDGLGLIEIRRKDAAGVIDERITFTYNEAHLLFVALDRILTDGPNKKT